MSGLCEQRGQNRKGEAGIWAGPIPSVDAANSGLFFPCPLRARLGKPLLP